ncbi:MAG: two-CW domain-containing protein [Candidatus Omnitrophota bacterium]
MLKQNCWEFKGCGRNINGAKSKELGVCPAAQAKEAQGFCGGTNGGRACVYICGTFCVGIVEGAQKDKEKNCVNCEFYKLLRQEEKASFNAFKYIERVKAQKK